ncbi:MAG: 8-oxo-dGTP diphosphatase [Clostridia bacterium]|nr:8-oxo-dGTP diphosphatase [Clostridia bacterium]
MLQTTLCYLIRDGKTLMLHRIKKKNDVNHDKWIGIGGKFEHGESPEECVAREFLEETGLTLCDARYRGIVTFLSDDWCEYMHLFTAENAEGQIKDCDEGTLEWIEWDRLTSLPIWEGDKVFLRLLETRDTFFSLKLVYDGERLVHMKLDGRDLDCDKWGI